MEEQNQENVQQEPQPQASLQQQESQQQSNEDITGVDDSRLYASFSYLFVLVFVPLLTRRGDEYVMYHARQGFVLFVLYIVASIAAAWIPVFGNLFFILLVIISIIGVIQALQGRRWKIPVITDIANKFTI